MRETLKRQFCVLILIICHTQFAVSCEVLDPTLGICALFYAKYS